MHNKTWSRELVCIGGPGDFQDDAQGSDFEIVQLKPGKLHGSVTHLGICDTRISAGWFNSDLRARGTLCKDKIVLGTVLDSTGRSSHWWEDMHPGDITVFPPNVAQDAIYTGEAAYLTVSIALPELLSMLEGEKRLEDPLFWGTKQLLHTDRLIGDDVRRQLKGILSGVAHKATIPSAQAADFLRRSIIEAFVLSLTRGLPAERKISSSTGARIVRETEDYVDAAGERPVHVSELCNVLKVPRRSLHRAFYDTLGMGPVSYLRRRRLSAVYSVLSRRDSKIVSIGDLAFENGFPESGRFAAFYRAHFGETPSETYLSRSVRTLNR
jgi:AraC family ethanolamine operon transcriptional activator